MSAGNGRRRLLYVSSGEMALFVLLSSRGVEMSSGRKLGVRRTLHDDVLSRDAVRVTPDELLVCLTIGVAVRG